MTTQILSVSFSGLRCTADKEIKTLQWFKICARCFIVASYKRFDHFTPVAYTENEKKLIPKT